MLTKAKIRKLTHASFYARGLDLYYNDAVKECAVEETSFVDKIHAKVKGSGRKYYQVEAVYDRASDDLKYSSCDCPAFYSYDGLCKHIIAALLQYSAYVTGKEGTLEELSDDFPDEEETSKSRSAEKPAPVLRKAALTSPEIKALLEQTATIKTAEVMQKQLWGKVRLRVEFTATDKSVEILFKTGITQMYIVKDVFAFARNVRNREFVTYGKKLQFTHELEAFEPDSRPLVSFLCNYCAERERQQGYRYGYYYSAILSQKELDLAGWDLEHFLLAVKDIPLYGRAMKLEKRDGSDYAGVVQHYWTPEKEWKVVMESPERDYEVTGKEGEVLIKGRRILSFSGDRHWIYFQEGKNTLPGKICLEERKSHEILQSLDECLKSMSGGTASIAGKELTAFCRDLFPALEASGRCKVENFSKESYGMETVRFEIYLDRPDRDMISCRLLAVYGEDKYNVFGDKSDLLRRDVSQEALAGELVSSYCNAYDEKSASMVLAGENDAIYELLTEGVPRMQKLGTVYISDELKKMKVRCSTRTLAGISLKGDMLELTMTSDDFSMQELAEILSRYDRKKKYYRLANGDFVTVQGDDLETLASLSGQLGLSEKQLRSEQVRLPKYRALLVDEILNGQMRPGQAEQSQSKREGFLPGGKAGTKGIYTEDQDFRNFIRNLKSVEEGNFQIPTSLQGVLREYQKTGFLWLKTLHHNGLGGVLADDMGLGKTLQIIAFLLSEMEEEASLEENRRTLIVTPASLVYNWYNEIRKFAPGLSVVMITGSRSERQERIEQASTRQILITSYDLLRRDQDLYEARSFFCQILDEAQFIKNHNTQAAKAVKEIHAGCRFALTGTPIENRLSELWSIFDYLMPGFLYSYEKFRKKIELPAMQQEKEALKQLQKMIRPFVLRRLKKDVLKDLPDKLEEDVYAVLEGEQRQLYDAHVKRLTLMLDKQINEEFASSRIQILAELTKLRQLCCHPGLLLEDYPGESAKTEMCLQLLRNAVSGGHKVLLFSQFTSMLELLCERLEKENFSYYTLTGSTSKEMRAQLVERFNQDDTNVFCISLKAGGTGLNLTAADIVIHYDPWWNLAVQDQATDRAHRIGQKHVVTVYKLLAKDTIEDNIRRLQEKKRELAGQVLAGEGFAAGSFTKEELREIIGG